MPGEIYDYADRVVKVTDRQGTPATIVEYEFDALGRRIKKDVTGWRP